MHLTTKKQYRVLSAEFVKRYEAAEEKVQQLTQALDQLNLEKKLIEEKARSGEFRLGGTLLLS